MCLNRIIHMDIHKKKKIALVLSGGGIKAAAYHIGVCLALKEKGFKFIGGTKDSVSLQKDSLDSSLAIQVYVGSSAGAFISSVLASGRSIESLVSAFQVGFGLDPSYVIDKEEKLKPIGYRHIFNLNAKRMLSFIPEALLEKSILSGGFEVMLKKGFKLNGLFNTHGVERYLRKYVLSENEFNKLGVELYIVATQLNHSRKTIFGPFLESTKTPHIKYVNYASISQAVAASTALPPVFAPYLVQKPDGKDIYHYDGEIRDTLSAHVAADQGADLVIASYSMQPYHYSPEIGSLHKFGMPTIMNQALYQVIEQKISKSIQFQKQKKDLYDSLSIICDEENLSVDLKKKILNKVKKSLDHNPKVDYLYISPRPQDYKMFFADHFSLNKDILEEILKIGFKSALHCLQSNKLDL